MWTPPCGLLVGPNRSTAGIFSIRLSPRIIIFTEMETVHDPDLIPQTDNWIEPNGIHLLPCDYSSSGRLHSTTPTSSSSLHNITLPFPCPSQRPFGELYRQDPRPRNYNMSLQNSRTRRQIKSNFPKNMTWQRQRMDFLSDVNTQPEPPRILGDVNIIYGLLGQLMLWCEG
jgi:hypothetical protein